LRPTDSSVSPRLLIGLIVGGLVAWGLYHAVGVFTESPDGDLRRPLIVLASFAAFLGSWLLLLARRKRSTGNHVPRRSRLGGTGASPVRDDEDGQVKETLL
jgi:hypothetical protein